MRLINADEMEELFNAQIALGATDLFAAFEDALQDAQTVDAVPVVWCKDCKYFAAKNSLETQGICRCENKDMYYGSEFYPFRDDFCSYGERRNDG